MNTPTLLFGHELAQAQVVHRLVRVQDALHGASVDHQGLCLPYDKSYDQAHAGRNTLHFTVNSLVSDHAYGSFNEHPDGSLKGKVVIIADPAALPPAAGVCQVDTWYRLSVQRQPDGQVKRYLQVGHATVVVPKGTAVPDGVNAVFYEGGIESRDEKVRSVLLAAGVKIEKAGARNWMDHDMTSAQAWGQSVAHLFHGSAVQGHSEAAGQSAKHADSSLHIGVHDSSIDSRLETLGVDGLLISMTTNRHHVGQGGEHIPYIDVITAKAAEDKVVIENFLASLPSDERQRVGLHYELQIQRMDEGLSRARTLENDWNRRELPGQIQSVVADLRGQGPFFLSKAGTATHESLSSTELVNRIESGGLSPKDLIWRSGMNTEWVEVQKTLLRHFVEAVLPAPPPSPPSFPSFHPSPQSSIFGAHHEQPATDPLKSVGRLSRLSTSQTLPRSEPSRKLRRTPH